MDEATQALHVPLVGGGQHGAGSEKQQALEDRVVEDVKQRGGERKRRRPAHRVGLKSECKPEADVDDADVLDRVVGEQTLQVVLHQRVNHSEHGGNATEEQHDHAPPPCGFAEQVKDDAHKAIHRNLGHDPAHQRRDVAGCRWMGKRQPDVERHQASLGACAEQGQGQGQAGDGGRVFGGTDGGKRVVAVRTGQQTEREQQGQRSEARHDQIDVTGPGVFPVPMMGHHQRPGGQRHELPAQQKSERVVSQNHQIHAGQKSREKWQHPMRRRLVAAIAKTVDTGGSAAEVYDNQEESGEWVEPKMGTQPGQTERQAQQRRCSGLPDQMHQQK